MSLFGEQIIGDAPACGRVSRFLLGCLAIWNTEVHVAQQWNHRSSCSNFRTDSMAHDENPS